jgi:hypothetical protein
MLPRIPILNPHGHGFMAEKSKKLLGNRFSSPDFPEDQDPG